MAEHDHNFSLAFELSRESLNLYKKSGLPTRESWSDGTEHAKEHIFMDLFDNAVALDRMGQKNESMTEYRRAFAFFNNDLMGFLKISKMDRVYSRIREYLYSYFHAADLKILSFLKGYPIEDITLNSAPIFASKFSYHLCRKLFSE